MSKPCAKRGGKKLELTIFFENIYIFQYRLENDDEERKKKKARFTTASEEIFFFS